MPNNSIPNVYIAGPPLFPQSKVFKGRRDIFTSLEREVSSHSDQRSALLLFGARRTGKSSILHQLPVFLGSNIVPVSVDMQSLSTSDNVISFLFMLAREIRKKALNNRQIILEEITRDDLQNDPYLVFFNWLQEIKKNIGDKWFLICLDEYESLETMVRDARIDERIFPFLRSLIQHVPHITFLLCGAHTLEDLSPIWSHYLISVRTIKITPLTEDDAKELILQPIPDFPISYDPDALNKLLQETGRHPYLIQSACRNIVDQLNGEKKINVKSEDVELAIVSALSSNQGYFLDLWKGPDGSDIQRNILVEIANAQTEEINTSVIGTALTYSKQEIQTGLNRLIHRDILEKNNSYVRFQSDMVRRWIRYQKLEIK